MTRNSPDGGVASHPTICRPSAIHISTFPAEHRKYDAYRVVKIEQRIYGDIRNMRDLRLARNEINWDEPFGVHFGPLWQFGPAFNGHNPNKSLRIEVNVTEERSRDNQFFVPSNALMNSSMSTTFEQLLEADEVAWKSVHHSLDAFRGE